MARLTRWGNSDGGLRIPKAILEAAYLRVGDEIGCRLLDSGAILLTPRKRRIEISDSQTQEKQPAQLKTRWRDALYALLKTLFASKGLTRLMTGA